MAELAFGERFDKDFTFQTPWLFENSLKTKAYKIYLPDELVRTCRKKEWDNISKQLGLYKDLREYIWSLTKN